ncbi:hypothetical protein GCM10023199_57530 [Actinomycetospora chibensis]
MDRRDGALGTAGRVGGAVTREAFSLIVLCPRFVVLGVGSGAGWRRTRSEDHPRGPPETTCVSTVTPARR